jgi:SAM-dependent methyltransferase
MARRDPDDRARRLIAESLASDDPTGWFERLYAAVDQGRAACPWDRAAPSPLLVDWAGANEIDGAGRRALVVGAGLGADAEYVAGLGFETVAFDIAPTAIKAAQRRFPDSEVQYAVADLLEPPPDWAEAFDLVVEILTVQSLPLSLRREAIAGVRRFVGPGGTLVVIAAIRSDAETAPAGPPWPLTRAEIESFAAGGLHAARIENVEHRWRAEFQRAN